MVYASRFLRWTTPEMQGPDVRLLQEHLQSCGYDPGSLDGCLDPQTAEAIIKFQKDRHVKADGIVDSETWMVLYNKMGGQLAGQTPGVIETRITIDVIKRRLYFSNPGLQKVYPVAVGKPSTPSPLGNWTIVQKALNPGGPFGTRWMRLSVPWGGYGIHGTNNPKSIGRAVSHGCIRMYNRDVEEIYPLSPIGTPVTIVGKAATGRVLQYKSGGVDVAKMQSLLRKLGYYTGGKDGYFGTVTRRAVMRFQNNRGLPPDGIVDPRTWLNLIKAYDLLTGGIDP